MNIPYNRRSRRQARHFRNPHSRDVRGHASDGNDLSFIGQIHESMRALPDAIEEILTGLRDIGNGVERVWSNSIRFIGHLVALVLMIIVPIAILILLIIRIMQRVG